LGVQILAAIQRPAFFAVFAAILLASRLATLAAELIAFQCFFKSLAKAFISTWLAFRPFLYSAATESIISY